MKRPKILLLTACGLILAGTAALAWNIFASRTHIAFVNYQAINLGQI